MFRTIALRAFLVGAPLAFAALLMRHPTGSGDFFTAVSENVTAWLTVHYGAAVLFPLMALVIWLLIRDLHGRAATVARLALPVFAAFYGVYEAMVGIAGGLVAQAANRLDGEAREGAAAAFDGIVGSPVVGEPSLFTAVGAVAWVTALTAAILALRSAGARTPALVLLALGGAMTFHVPPLGPIALVCLSVAAFLIERERAPVVAAPRLGTAAAS